MKSFNITLGRFYQISSSDTINELLGRLLMQDIHPDGFEEIILSQFYKNVIGKLDLGLVDRLFELSQNLTKFTLNHFEDYGYCEEEQPM